MEAKAGEVPDVVGDHQTSTRPTRHLRDVGVVESTAGHLLPYRRAHQVEARRSGQVHHLQPPEELFLHEPAGVGRTQPELAPEVVLEFTERSPIDSVPDVRERARRLRALGFRLAIDDLGSGYAGLTSFVSLQPDFVKLDRGLIARIDHEPVKRKLVGSIVAVSREMGIAVVAEGVETAGERDTAAEIGCDLMQGFLFRRPDELREDETFPLPFEGPGPGRSEGPASG